MQCKQTYQQGTQRSVRGGQATAGPWASASKPGQQAPSDEVNSWSPWEYALLGVFPYFTRGSCSRSPRPQMTTAATARKEHQTPHQPKRARIRDSAPRSFIPPVGPPRGHASAHPPVATRLVHDDQQSPPTCGVRHCLSALRASLRLQPPALAAWAHSVCRHWPSTHCDTPRVYAGPGNAYGSAHGCSYDQSHDSGHKIATSAHGMGSGCLTVDAMVIGCPDVDRRVDRFFVLSHFWDVFFSAYCCCRQVSASALSACAAIQRRKFN